MLPLCLPLLFKIELRVAIIDTYRKCYSINQKLKLNYNLTI